MKIVFFIYGMIARLAFEWALPIYSIIAPFSPVVIATIWSLFLIWQIPITIYLIQDMIAKLKNQAKDVEKR